MEVVFKKAKHSKVDVRRDALRTLACWEDQRSNLDEISKGFLKFLPQKHRGFYTELTKGTVRQLLFIDYKLEKVLERPLKVLTPWIRNILRLGGYQLEFMDLPKPVTVDVMVELAKAYGHPGTAKLVNGALRKWATGFSPTLPQSLDEQLSVVYSHPFWLVKRWLARFGEQETRALLAWNNTPPCLDLVLNSLRVNSEEFLQICRENGISVIPTFLESSFSLNGSGSVEALPGFREGLFWVQGLSAQLPVYLLDPKPGEVIVDLCAAPGGKSCQIASMTRDNAKVVSVDKSVERLKKVDENRRRLGLQSIHQVLASGESIEETLFGLPDAILLDAPCSATGVFRRKADARWSKTPEDLQRYSEVQYALLKNAAKLLKPGGRIIYSTCSMEPEENQEIIHFFLNAHPHFSLEDPLPYFPKSAMERLTSRDRVIQILPQRENMDGFFMARMVKNVEH